MPDATPLPQCEPNGPCTTTTPVTPPTTVVPPVILPEHTAWTISPLELSTTGVVKDSDQAAAPRCEEDQPCWNCATMGNHICGPVATSPAVASYPTSCPAPLVLLRFEDGSAKCDDGTYYGAAVHAAVHAGAARPVALPTTGTNPVATAGIGMALALVGAVIIRKIRPSAPC